MLMIAVLTTINIVFHVEHRGGVLPHLRNPHREGALNSVKNGRTVADLNFLGKILRFYKVSFCSVKVWFSL